DPDQADEIRRHSMARWEQLEEWLYDTEPDTFTSHDVAAGLHVSYGEASEFISAYLEAQRAENSRTLFVLKRSGRTSAAIWSYGDRVVDARAISRTLRDDVHVKVLHAFAPDLRRLATRNPRAAKRVERVIRSVVDGALVVL